MVRANAERQRYLKELRKNETKDTKLCPKCEQVLPLSCFHKTKNKEARKGRATMCSKCSSAYTSNRYTDGKGRNYRLEKLYGITLEQYDTMLESQGNKCAICGSVTPKRGTRFIVDHCHKTGNVRGLLCHLCNTLLGMAEDSATTLTKAAKYLEVAHVS